MSERFLKFFPSRESLYLARKHPNAFILLVFIAHRARRTHDDPDGYTIGQCHIGDHNDFGLTEKEYRTAKRVLVERELIKIVETCRTRKSNSGQDSDKNFKNHEKSATERATRTTTYGTLVELCDSTVWDINPESENQREGDRKGDRRATEGRPKGDDQEGIRKKKKEKEEEHIAQSAAPLRTRDSLSFDFESWEFVGITEQDVADWKVMYSHIDLQIEKTKATQWLRNNPTKNNKKLWRKYLTGWFGRANESIENKKAYRSAAGGANQDRRTKDIHGNPVESPHTGRF